MTFHSKSAVEFGQLLNNLTGSLTNGSPVPFSLDVVKEHFQAQAVLLGISSRGHDCVLVADSEYEPFADEAAYHDKSVTVGSMMERYQHIAASEYDASGATDYSLWVFRDREGKRFDNEETALAGVLITQIARALDLASRIDDGAMEKALYSDALDRLGVGVIVVDNQGRLVSTSSLADSFLSAREGLQIQAGKLRAANAAEDRELQKTIRAFFNDTGEAKSDTSLGLPLTKRSGARTLGIVARRVCTPRAGDLVAIYLRDCDTIPEVENEFVRRIFDLTPAEAAVTNRLAAGDTLEDAAVTLGISRNTARAHLRSIFSKSGITRQTELVRLVLNSAVPLGDRSCRAA